MKIYTRTGDRGETGLIGGHRVSKDHPCIEACGDLDEANSAIGLALVRLDDSGLRAVLLGVQQDLFAVGAKVAACLGKRQQPSIDSSRIAELEQLIDRYQERLTPLTAFILPGGARTGAFLHFARAVLRRGERRVVEVSRLTDLTQTLEQEITYLNRLADLLFVLARVANQQDGAPESQWLPDPRQP